jgi:predicted phage terminase large subunit-like protein
LCPPETFDILLGRLREDKNGDNWLSSAFTPRGKANWTYKSFACGAPDTEVFYAKTGDNTFNDPGYLKMLRGRYAEAMAVQELEAQFLDFAGSMFQPAWFRIIEAYQVPPLALILRCWDLASTDPNEAPTSYDPDWTVGLKGGRGRDGNFYFLDMARLRGSPATVEATVTRTARQDGRGVGIWFEKETGAAGKIVANHYAKILASFTVRFQLSTWIKEVRAQPFAANAENRLIRLVRGPWNDAFLSEAELFPASRHEDCIDAGSLLMSKLALPATGASGVPVVLSEPRLDPFGPAPVHGHYPRGGPHTMPGYVIPIPRRQENQGRGGPFIIPGGW